MTILCSCTKNIKDSNTASELFEELSEGEIASINRGIEDHDQGEVLTSKEFWQEWRII